MIRRAGGVRAGQPSKGEVQPGAELSEAEFEALLARVTPSKRAVRPVTVAVLDLGFNPGVDALTGRLWANPRERRNGLDDDGNLLSDDINGYDFSTPGPLAAEAVDHGTAVAALALARSRRLEGMLLKMWDARTPEAWRGPNAETAIRYAVAKGARVINISAPVTGQLRGLVEAHPDVLFVLAAGNLQVKLGDPGSFSPPEYLAANHLPNLLVVGGTDQRGAPWQTADTFMLDGEKWKVGTAFGEQTVQVAANAEAVWSVDAGGYPARFDGTSFAAPQVTSIAGRALVLDPELTPDQLVRLVVASADESAPWTVLNGAGGVANARVALTVAALHRLEREGVSVSRALDRLGVRDAALRLRCRDALAALG